MSNLSDKIRIVSSDGEVIEEAKSSGPEVKESIFDRVKGGFSGKKEVDEDNNDFNDDSIEESVERDSVVDRVKNMLSKDRDVIEKGAPRDHLKNPEDDKGFTGLVETAKRKKDDFLIDVEEKVEENQGKSETPLLIGIIVALAVVGIAAFIYFFNSSSMAKFDVVPQQVEDQVIQEVLSLDQEEFSNFMDVGVDQDDMAEVEPAEVVEEEVVEDIAEETGIVVDTAQAKEIAELEGRIEQLKAEIDSHEGVNEELEVELSEVVDLYNSIKDSEGLGE